MEDSPIASDDRTRIIELISRYAQALDAGDVEAVLGCMTDDVALSYNGDELHVDGKPKARPFFAAALTGPSTHLLGNYLLERKESAIRARCSGIAFVTRHAGTVTVRGLLYTFTCLPDKRDLRIKSLQHRANWEYSVAGAVPGGRPPPGPGP